jgi:hypothetical protein
MKRCIILFSLLLTSCASIDIHEIVSGVTFSDGSKLKITPGCDFSHFDITAPVTTEWVLENCKQINFSYIFNPTFSAAW